VAVNIVVSTGAGISAESGIHTYRDEGGLWTKYDPMVVSHRNGWLSQPEKVLEFKNELRRQFEAGNYTPNPAHYALARLQKEWQVGEVTIVTQNIDGLHVDAGAVVTEIHGTGREKLCEGCGHRSAFDSDILLSDPCVVCGVAGKTRPAIVMFGEMPYGLEELEKKLDQCSVFAVVGSSLEVMPGNLFVHAAKEVGARTFYLNKEAPKYIDLSPYDERIYGPASETVPKWVNHLLTELKPWVEKQDFNK
jgi:NAD-dependent deacetylase